MRAVLWEAGGLQLIPLNMVVPSCNLAALLAEGKLGGGGGSNLLWLETTFSCL